MRTAVVTGGNRGIGYAVCESLVDKGYRVLAVTRSAAVPAGADAVHGDLSSRRTVAALATTLANTCDSIDLLVHNAGVWPTRRRLNEDGIEESFAVNHLAPFQLNLALEVRLRRVVQVSAGLHVKGRVDPDRTPTGADFHRIRTYCDTKRANLLLVPLFATRWQDAGVTIDAVHPGVIRTDLGDPDGMLGAVLKLVKRRWAPPAEGAAAVVAVAEKTGTGRYFDVTTESPMPVEPELAHRLWDQAGELTGAGQATQG
jgi:NAD(P)-dependent dehydrogenase (short-subunit alcohol dehydrogenase family)